jgi:DMSO/TMAO reductase YedYZ molybdopterin-dependent catalytic subunit
MAPSQNPFNDPKYQPGEPPTAEQQADDVIVSPDTQRRDRMPPGQSRTRRWPVLDAFGLPPAGDLATWRLDWFGLVKHPGSLNWKEFQALPRVRVFADFHCVTRWSRLGNLWEGVSTSYLGELAGVSEDAKYVVLYGRDHGWTTNLPLSAFLAEDSLLADRHDGEPIALEHGGPVRVIVPRLYAWKSAKWVERVEFVSEDRAGYWENGGYHMTGDPWKEERFRWD